MFRSEDVDVGKVFDIGFDCFVEEVEVGLIIDLTIGEAILLSCDS